MAPSLKDLSKYKEKVEKVVKKGKKVVGLAKSAKALAEDIRGAAGKSKCSGKNCSWKEQLDDIVERVSKGGKRAMERKGDIESLVKKGRKLIKNEDDEED